MAGTLRMETSAASVASVASVGVPRPRQLNGREIVVGEKIGFSSPRHKVCTNLWTAEPTVPRKCAHRGLAFAQGANGSVAPAEGHPITLHVGETSFTMPFSSAAAKGLNAAIDGLFQTFKEREKATRPQRWKTMEYRQTGDGVFLEVFCNPNAYSNAFQAKVLITIKDEKIKIASEGQLSTLKADIDQYVDQILKR